MIRKCIIDSSTMFSNILFPSGFLCFSNAQENRFAEHGQNVLNFTCSMHLARTSFKYVSFALISKRFKGTLTEVQLLNS